MFKWKLREILEAKGIAQKDLAKVSKVSKNTINTLCRGGVHSTSLNTLSKLAKTLRVNPWDIAIYNPRYRKGKT
jgi:DNA-binding Xre family transcriptional regulator